MDDELKNDLATAMGLYGEVGEKEYRALMLYYLRDAGNILTMIMDELEERRIDGHS